MLVIGGAVRTPGAAVLAGLAALRAGAGRLTLSVAQSAAIAAAITVPEAGVVGLPDNSSGAGQVRDILEPELGRADVVVLEPGLDDAERTLALLQNIAPLLRDDTSLVLDAFALGVLVGLVLSSRGKG